MKASKFSDGPKAFILKQGADGIPVADICRKAGTSQATYFNLKKKYNGLLPTEMWRLKLLEDENAKFEKLVADLSLDREMLQDIHELRAPTASAPAGAAQLVIGKRPTGLTAARRSTRNRRHSWSRPSCHAPGQSPR